MVSDFLYYYRICYYILLWSIIIPIDFYKSTTWRLHLLLIQFSPIITPRRFWQRYMCQTISFWVGFYNRYIYTYLGSIQKHVYVHLVVFCFLLFFYVVVIECTKFSRDFVCVITLSSCETTFFQHSFLFFGFEVCVSYLLFVSSYYKLYLCYLRYVYIVFYGGLLWTTTSY